MLPEPLAVPMIESVHQTWYYCLECGFKASDKYPVENHWRYEHGGPEQQPTLGVDFCTGSQLLLLQHRRREWIEQQAREFAMALHPGFGPDDLVAEAEIGDA